MTGSGTLDLDGTYVIDQPLSVGAGSKLVLRGNWDNNSSIAQSGGTIELRDTFTVADLGTFTGTGGAVSIFGTLDGSGTPVNETLTIDTTRQWLVSGGTLRNVTIAGAGASALLQADSSGTLDGVTLNVNTTLLGGGVDNGNQVTVLNGLTLMNNHVLRLTRTREFEPANAYDVGLNFSGSQTLGGTGVVELSSNLASSNDVTDVRVRPTGGATLTIGPGITVRNMTTSKFATLGDASTAGGALINQGTVLAQSSGQTLRVTGSSVANTGSLESRAGGTLEVRGLAPHAGRIFADVGSTVSHVGDFTQQSTGTIATAIRGTGASNFGRFAVSGVANLDGTLDAILVNGYAPPLGASFQVITATTRSGAFSTLSGSLLPNNLVFEPVYSGNAVTLVADEPEVPDLIASSVTVPAQGKSGGLISVAFTVQNNGVGSTTGSSWFDRIILSANGTAGDADDITLDQPLHTGTLAPGASYNVSRTVRLPLGLAGPFRVFVQTDSAGEVNELANENNNVTMASQTLTIAAPDFADLATSNVTAPATGVGGLLTTVTWTVANAGPNVTGIGEPGSSVDRWYDRIIASTNGVFGDADDRELALVERQGVLLPGQSYQGEWTGSIPVSLSGQYFVFVHSDSGDAVYEYTNSQTNVARSTGTLNVLSSPRIVDDFDDANLATNSTGIGTGWLTATTGGGGAETDSAFRFDGRNRGNSQYWEISGRDDFNFTNGPTVVARFHTGNVAVTADQAAADWRQQLAVVSANEPKSGGSSRANLFNNTRGGLYVELDY